MKILVAGPPCAGKSTYVGERADPGALVLDQDVIGRKVMNQRLAAIHRAVSDVWIIRCAPGRDARARLARSLGCDDTVLLCPPEEELRRRALLRDNPAAALAGIRKWMLAEHGLTAPRSPHRTGHAARRVRAETFAVHGDVCWICGHAGARDSDHVIPVSVQPGQRLSAEGRRPAHGTTSRCPTCRRACNTERGTKAAGEVFVPRLSW